MVSILISTLASLAVLVQSDDTNVTCTTSEPCSYTTINCNTSSADKCTISCIGDGSCQNSTIICGPSSLCDVTCETRNSCRNFRLNGTDSNYLNVSLGTTLTGYSAHNGRVFCPSNGGIISPTPNNNCQINCDPDGNFRACHNFTISAINGMLDLVITDFRPDNMMVNTDVFCGGEYQFQCRYSCVLFLFCFFFFSIFIFEFNLSFQNKLHK